MISLKYNHMIKFIKITAYIFFITLLLSEIVVRNAMNWIPQDLITYLSPKAALKVYQERGLIQDEDSYIYHYRPFQKMNYFSFLKIDENGYRNSVERQTKVDTVLLGDSLIFAKRSKVDLGDLFREKNRSVLNLSISGYAPQHYRDTYKKYVIDKKIQHKNVIVSIFVGNDFSDSERYPWDLSPTIGEGNPNYPWIINLIIGASNRFEAVKNYNIDIIESKHRVSLPYKEIGIRYLWWTPTPTDDQWNKVDESLREILKMAKKSSAKVSFVIIPSPSSVYGVKLHSDFSAYVDNHNKIVKEFRKRFKNINIIDINKEISTEIEKEFLYVEESDAHFNTHGTKVFFNIILEKLDLQDI